MNPITIYYTPGTEGIKNYGLNNAAADADIVVGKDGRILKARSGDRWAREQIKKMQKEVAK